MVSGQTLDTTKRNQLIQFVSNGLSYGVTIPDEWNAGDPDSHIHFACYGNTEIGSAAGYLDNYTPYRWMTSWSMYFAQYGAWKGTTYLSNGKKIKNLMVMIPNLDGSGGTPSKYAAVLTQIIRLTKIDTSDHTRFTGSAISGGPQRAINAMCLSGDTSYPYMRLIDKFVFMSPTNIGQSQATIRTHLQGSRYLVWFTKNDGNAGTPPSAAYSLYNKLPETGYRGIDSMATGGHTRTTWDSCMTINKHDLVNGGNAATNRWRFLGGDAFTSNTLPTANAGADQNIGYLDPFVLTGSGSDPDGTVSTYAWSKVSGPACTITSPNSATTTITGFGTGLYTFQLRVTDNLGGSATDNINIEVTGGNFVPVVNAGADLNVFLPTNTATLSQATASDPDGTISTYLWTKIDGPAGGDISTPNALVTGLTDLREGNYTYRLTATDNSGAQASSELQVVVFAETGQSIRKIGRRKGT